MDPKPLELILLWCQHIIFYSTLNCCYKWSLIHCSQPSTIGLFSNNLLTCHSRKIVSVNNNLFMNDYSIQPLHFQGPAIVHVGLLSRCGGSLGQMNGTDLLLMLLDTPGHFLLWRVKMSAVNQTYLKRSTLLFTTQSSCCDSICSSKNFHMGNVQLLTTEGLH